MKPDGMSKPSRMSFVSVLLDEMHESPTIPY